MKMWIAIQNDLFNLQRVLKEGITTEDEVGQVGSDSAIKRGHKGKALLCQKLMFPISDTISINVAFEKPLEEIWVDWDDGIEIEECAYDCHKCNTWQDVEDCVGKEAVSKSDIQGAYVLDIKPDELEGIGIYADLPNGNMEIDSITGKALVEQWNPETQRLENITKLYK